MFWRLVLEIDYWQSKYLPRCVVNMIWHTNTHYDLGTHSLEQTMLFLILHLYNS